ncbi:MAG: YcxB family protein [Desulfuromusa sp.]
MSQVIKIKHDLSEKEWRIFYNVYYLSDKRFKLRFIYGTGSWIIGAAGLFGLFNNNLIAFGMIAFGLYCVFARQFLVNRALKKVKAKPDFPGTIDYTIDQDKIAGIEQGMSFEFNWETFHGYRDAKPGLLIYLKEAAFFFIPNEAISAEEKEDIVSILKLNRVLDLATK